jgi:hypothetical protein
MKNMREGILNSLDGPPVSSLRRWNKEAKICEGINQDSSLVTKFEIERYIYKYKTF